MGVGEPRAPEIGHGIGFAPNNVVQNPIAGVLNKGADAENVVIGADHPNGAVGL